MTNYAIKVLVGSEEKLRHTASETVDFTMLTVSGTPTADTDVMTKAAVASVASAYIPLTQKAASNGVATLDAAGKIPAAQLPNSVMEYKGSYNATLNLPSLADGGAATQALKVIQGVTFQADDEGSAGNSISVTYVDPAAPSQSISVVVVDNAITINLATDADSLITTTVNDIVFAVGNTPAADAIVDASGSSTDLVTAQAETFLTYGQDAANAGDVYRCSVAGTIDLGSGDLELGVGDFVIYSGSIWEKSPATDAVISVNGQVGVVSLDSDDVGEGSTNLYFTDSRAKTAAVVDSLDNDPVLTDQAPSVNAVATALALKADLSSEYKTLTNDNAGAITVGQIVYIKSNGNVDLAKADAIGTCSGKLGIVMDASIASAGSGKIWMLEGKSFGGYSSLTIGAKYLLSATTAGAITTDVPSTVDHCIVVLGKTCSATELVFNPKDPIEILS